MVFPTTTNMNLVTPHELSPEWKGFYLCMLWELRQYSQCSLNDEDIMVWNKANQVFHNLPHDRRFVDYDYLSSQLCKVLSVLTEKYSTFCSSLTKSNANPLLKFTLDGLDPFLNLHIMLRWTHSRTLLSSKTFVLGFWCEFQRLFTTVPDQVCNKAQSLEII